MEKFIYVFIHLLLPLILLLDHIYRKSNNKLGLLTKTLLYIAILYFLYLWGQWPLVGSYYFRYIMIVIMVAIALIGMSRIASLQLLRPLGVFKNLILVMTGALFILFCVIINFAINGKSYISEGVSLDFPLKNGTYYIASGGSSKLINNHMRDYPNSQEFALDINKLGRFKGVSKQMLGSVNTEHYIFTDTIYCPCNGKVVSIKNNVKDNLAGSMQVDSKNGRGNFVRIYCEDETVVLLPHMKQFSVLVKKNIEVKTGDPLGLVGISGFSQEPHLHIQAAKFNSDSTLIGVPINFNGVSLSRNDIYEN